MEFWVYENTIHRKARVHRADCSFCSDGRGIHGGGQTPSGKWLGPFPDMESADTAARNTRQDDTRACGVCLGSSSVPGNAASQTIQQTLPGAVTGLGPWEWDQREELMCALRLYWIPREESENLKRRFANYRNPGPSQQTNLRINAWLIELLSSGGEVSVATVEDARMTTKRGETNADFSVKSIRRLFEHLAISLEHASEIETLNR